MTTVNVKFNASMGMDDVESVLAELNNLSTNMERVSQNLDTLSERGLDVDIKTDSDVITVQVTETK